MNIQMFYNAYVVCVGKEKKVEETGNLGFA